MTTPPAPPDLATTVRDSWQRFRDDYEPLGADLYRYCRYLTRTPWDAEDLSQDAMARAFVTLGNMVAAPPNPRAWLFRVASNLWIDQTRRKREAPDDGRDAPHPSDDPRAPREAAGTLLVRLSPQERAAVVLKDVFDFTLEEIADALSTTTGAIKIALHRGRGKLVEPETPEARSPAPGALDAFCSAFNARDLDRLTSLLLDNATIEVVGVHMQHDASRARDTVLTGMLFGSQRMAESDTLGGMDPKYRFGVLPTPARFEIRAHRGEWLLVSWYAHTDGEFVRAVTRVEIEGDRVSRVRNYFFTPSFIEDVCRELGLPCRVNGYRSC